MVDEREIKLRCIESAADRPYSDAADVINAASLWYDFIMGGCCKSHDKTIGSGSGPPMGRTSAARSKAAKDRSRK